MQQLGQYHIPSGYKRRPNIDRILFYYDFDPRVQHDYISFLQTEREFEIKYRNRYKDLTENFKGALPKDKDWALSTHLYRAISDRKSSASFEDALKDYWFLCKLKEDYYDIEKSKMLKQSQRIFPPISKIQISEYDNSATSSPVIGQPPSDTQYRIEPDVDQPIFGAPPTVDLTKSTERQGKHLDNHLRTSRRKSVSEYKPQRSNESLTLKHSSSKQPSFDSNISTTSTPRSVRSQPETSINNFDSRVVGKPVMKVYPVHSSQDQRSLAAQNKHLRDLLQTQTEEIMSLRNLDRENQDIVQNLKLRLSSCTCDENPTTADYTMNTSSAEIAQRFADIYDNEYKTAIETLTSRHRDRITEDVALFSMMEIIKRCYKLCTAVAAEQVENMTSLMKDQVIQPCVTQQSTVQKKASTNDMKRIHSDAERLARLFRKRHCVVTITNLNDKFNEELDNTVDFTTHLKTPEVCTLIEKCLETIWLMCNQDPPMLLQWPEQGDIFDTTLYKYYNRKGFKVNFAVWPVVLMNAKGPVLCKGFAVPI